MKKKTSARLKATTLWTALFAAPGCLWMTPTVAQAATPTVKAAGFPAPSPDGVPLKVACVGDSITAGVGASGAARNYPSLLAKMLGPQYVVGNFGESGATLLKHGDSPYWQRGGYAASAAFAPDVVVVMLGANDSKPQNWVHQDEFAADYAALLDYYAALPAHPRLYVCLPTPVPRPNYGINEPVVTAEIPLIRRVAAQKGAAVIDVHGQVPSDPADFADGVHPNDAGYVLLAGAVYQGLTHAPLILPGGGGAFSFYPQAEVTIKPPAAGVPVRYTTDGSAPTGESALYKGPFAVRDTTTVQARTFAAHTPPSPVSAATFTRLTPLPAQKPANVTPGLTYSYYEASFQNVAGFSGQTPAATGAVPDFRLTPHTRDTDFGFKFEGYVDAPAQGLYTFGTTSDDGSTLAIDGQPVVDNDGLHGAATSTGTVALAPGRHRITVLYFQGGGDAILHVTWQGPGIATQDIPAAALSHG